MHGMTVPLRARAYTRVVSSGRLIKRVLVGRAMRSDHLGETLLPKKLALPVFASDALSSVAYAPDEILLTLGLAGGALAMTHSWPVALGVVAVMAVVVASYRQNVHAYPSGGGDYEVASTNLGRKAGLTVASALLVDYVLTVAVSISSGVQNAAAALPWIRGHEVFAALVLIAALTGINLRGVRESGKAFAIPTYLFMLSVIAMGLVGVVRRTTGTLPQAESGPLQLAPEPGMEQLGTLAMAFLLLRAFSSGCAALTGVEAISNGVPAFRKPKSTNAATTLLLMGGIAITMLVSMIALASWTGVKVAEDPATQLLRDGQPVGEEYVQHTVMAQVAQSVFDGFPAGVVIVSIVTGLILVLAANTAFNGFPVLGSILARDGYLPRQLHTRGDRLAFSNGILLLAAAAGLLIVIYDAQVTKLIQLYIVGVFVSFTLSQIGMVRHWNRHLALEKDRREQRAMMRRRAINAVGAAMSGTVLVVVVLTKFTHGAGFAMAAMAGLFVLMGAISRHYRHVRDELSVAEGDTQHQLLPSRVHAIVLVSTIHRPTLRALAYASATRPSRLEAVTVDVDHDATRALQAEWDRRAIPVPLKALDSPYREITRPVVEYVKSIRSGNPRDLVVVYIPQYVLGHWWEQALHNQSALRLRSRLIFTPGVMVSSVPWQLASSAGAEERMDGPVAGDVRRGGS
ncbi:amino acid/polyamine/organocation transporter APC superfamily protein [Janibacter hoylei PVAS-1]|uniref:Amino acid/polyamine/organocation transporter APC superfamily protein n=2 Tax=Janibacter hoylei PVAS-1 TaxID=1210046 RepID=K1E9D4_9MICO|nr:amino acid/polyamine/organocation transporter APC superfamily protein [Janibacter hoylei PVAS-1]